MTERIRIICSHLPVVRTFADVGCDHGYCTRFMFEEGRCERAYISDISRESLRKAELLLREHILAGRCIPVCADGMTAFPETPDCVLIAGMGGEEIIHILSEADMPPSFVLQPMRNTDKVRAYLLSRGCRILKDFTFSDGKYYDLIVGEGAGGDEYTDWEIAYGRDNLRTPSPEFVQKLRKEQRELRKLLEDAALSRESREEVRGRLYRLEAITDAIEGDL